MPINLIRRKRGMHAIRLFMMSRARRMGLILRYGYCYSAVSPSGFLLVVYPETRKALNKTHARYMRKGYTSWSWRRMPLPIKRRVSR